MNLSELCIRRPVMTTLVTIGITVFGWMAYRTLPVNDLPNVDYLILMDKVYVMAYVYVIAGIAVVGVGSNACRAALGVGRAGCLADPAPWPRALLPALQALPRRQEAPAAGQLLAALRAAGARRGARCAGAGRGRLPPGRASCRGS